MGQTGLEVAGGDRLDLVCDQKKTERAFWGVVAANGKLANQKK